MKTLKLVIFGLLVAIGFVKSNDAHAKKYSQPMAEDTSEKGGHNECF